MIRGRTKSPVRLYGSIFEICPCSKLNPREFVAGFDLCGDSLHSWRRRPAERSRSPEANPEPALRCCWNRSRCDIKIAVLEAPRTSGRLRAWRLKDSSRRLFWRRSSDTKPAASILDAFKAKVPYQSVSVMSRDRDIVKQGKLWGLKEWSIGNGNGNHQRMVNVTPKAGEEESEPTT